MTPETQSDLARLAKALDQLAGHRFVRIHNSTLSLVWFQFLRGIAFGFGTVVGATILVSVAVFSLSQIEFIPIIGDLASDIIREIQTNPR